MDLITYFDMIRHQISLKVYGYVCDAKSDGVISSDEHSSCVLIFLTLL